MKTSLELREERATLIAEARKTYNEAEAREGGFTEADEQAYERAMEAAEKLGKQIARIERLESAEQELETPAERRGAPLERESTESHEEGETPRQKAEKLSAYRHWLRTGEVREAIAPEARSAKQLAESRDLTIATTGQGGAYLVTPVQISDDIVRQMDNFVYIRQLCQAAGSITVVTSAQKLGIRQKLTRMNQADWTPEIGTVNPDAAMTFGRRDLEPQQISKLALVSIRTLMLSRDAEREVNDELAYQFAITQENVFMNGTGTSQPLGVFIASTNGIDTSRDVTASSTTTFTGDNLIDMKYSLRRPYRADPSCAWMVSRPFVKIARKLKVASTTGGNDLEYIWQPGLTGGAPDRILDIPYNESEYAPSTFTTGLYVAVLGCFRYYRIAELPQIMIQRLVELYAPTGEIGFIGRHYVDGAPVLAEAFSRLKLA
jgi:HK97 family phage major capsid protein